MLARICLLSALLIGAFVQTAAGANHRIARWGQVGGWYIGVDRAYGDSCFAAQDYQDGTSLLIGFDMKKRTIYFMLANDGWRSLEADRVYPVQLVFDEQKRYADKLATFVWEDRVVLGHHDVSGDFARDFMERGSLRIFRQGTLMAHLSLRNTYAALAQAVDCQKEMLAARGASNSGMRPASNPFTR